MNLITNYNYVAATSGACVACGGIQTGRPLVVATPIIHKQILQLPIVIVDEFY